MTINNRELSEFAEPGMGGPEQGIQAPEQEVIGVQDGGVDREGAMAKADLYKLASYAHKLYEKIGEEDQLEAWVQAKITKAADYIASVYHYLEYEMKFSEYGHHLDNSDTLSESQKAVLKNKLTEARSKMKQLKIAQAEKVGEGFEKSAKPGDTFKTGTGGTATKTKTGLKHTAGKNYSGKADEKDNKKKKDDDLDEGFEKDAKPGDSFKTGTGGTATKTKTGLKHTAGKNYSGKGADKDEKKEKDLDESKPSAGLSKAKKASTVKKAKAGGDIGKPGKGFAKVAAKAAKEYGSKEKGEKVAAAAMWKNIKKEAVETLSEKAKPDFADLDKDGDKKEPMKKAAKEKQTVKESTDLNRMKEFLTRLNG